MNQSDVQKACLHMGLNPQEITYLGEGAWHHAWKIQHKAEFFVLRIPKKIAYGRTVEYNEAALNAEYGGTALYYETVNQAMPGAAPAFFKYYVSSELTYTVEEFAGENLNLQSLSKQTALQTGRKIGEIYRKTEEVPVGLNGFGFLAYSSEQGLHGQYNWEFSRFLERECTGLSNSYQALRATPKSWGDLTVETALEKAFSIRRQAVTSLVLTNQDASPENILVEGEQIRLIDPYPILYRGPIMAGKFMNLYEMLFDALAETERYSRHRFTEHKQTLRSIAEGFLEGYCEGAEQKANEVRAEQLLQVLQTAMKHVELLADNGISTEIRIRYGSKEMIQKRLDLLNAELKRVAGLIK